MRQLIAGMGLFLSALPAQATIIDFSPSFVIEAIGGSSAFTIENLQTLSRSSSTSASGSGSAIATIGDWDQADIQVALGDGPGQATASLVNVTTFDLVFADTSEVGLEAGFGIDGPLQTDPGDTSFANWDISIEIDGPLLAESQEHRCEGGIAVVGSCLDFFDDSIGQFPFTPNADRRLSVRTSLSFDIGVFRAAAAVPEPGAIAILLLSLAWIGRRTLMASSLVRATASSVSRNRANR